jgi:toxin secretion/phage lysis holin
MKDFAIKGTITVVFAAAAAYFHKLMGPVIVLAIVMAGDYITGVAAAWVAGTLSSRAGLLGFIKKLGYLVAVGVAVVVDYVIVEAAAGTGMELGNNHIFGLLVTIWFILNECISILENLSEIGVPLPGFLSAIVKRLKKSTEKTGEAHANQDDEKKKAPDDADSKE